MTNYPHNFILDLRLNNEHDIKGGVTVLVPSLLLEIERLPNELKRYIKTRYDSPSGYTIGLKPTADKMGISENKAYLYEIRVMNYFKDPRVQTHFIIGRKTEIKLDVEIERLYDILHHVASGNIRPEQLTFVNGGIVKRPIALDRHTPIALIDLTHGDYNKLARSNITHVEQLDAMSRSEVLDLRNIGEASLKRIEKAIRDYGYDLTYSAKPVRLETPAIPLNDALADIDKLAKKTKADPSLPFPVEMYVNTKKYRDGGVRR